MHHAGISALGILVAQDRCHILIRIAAVDNQRQAGFARGGNVDAQGLLLRLRTFGGIVIIQSGLADADHLGVLRDLQQLLQCRHRLGRDTHRVGACGVEDGGVRLGDGAHGRLVGQLCADGDHPRHTCVMGTRDNFGQFRDEFGEI